MPGRDLSDAPAVAFGLYGKLPAHGDFVRRGGPAGALAQLDRWLDAELGAAIDTGLAADDAVAGLAGWRFAWVGEHGVTLGVAIAGRDRVGRGFPLIALRSAADAPAPDLAELWCRSAEAILTHARDAALDADAALAMLAAPGDAADRIARWHAAEWPPASPDPGSWDDAADPDAILPPAWAPASDAGSPARIRGASEGGIGASAPIVPASPEATGGTGAGTWATPLPPMAADGMVVQPVRGGGDDPLPPLGEITAEAYAAAAAWPLPPQDDAGAVVAECPVPAAPEPAAPGITRSYGDGLGATRPDDGGPALPVAAPPSGGDAHDGALSIGGRDARAVSGAASSDDGGRAPPGWWRRGAGAAMAAALPVGADFRGLLGGGRG